MKSNSYLSLLAYSSSVKVYYFNSVDIFLVDYYYFFYICMSSIYRNSYYAGYIALD